MTAFTVQTAATLEPTLAAELGALAALADTTDGASALSEESLLALRHDTAGTHLVAYRAGSGEVIGYGHLGPSAAEWVVHPMWRRRGVGRALAEAALTAAAGGVLAVWAHGDHPAASALALRLEFTRARELWQLRRRLAEPITPPRLPDGVAVRAYRRGADDEAWLRLNARAFADHPEQGRWTAEDLRRRQAEPWFDPAGFLLAERVTDGALLGFHWTKVHASPQGAAALGEVYVLGVDPGAHGQGLGRALTLAGLSHLHSRGLDQVLLYVDETNAAATALYTGLGFVRHTTDVQYRH